MLCFIKSFDCDSLFMFTPCSTTFFIINSNYWHLPYTVIIIIIIKSYFCLYHVMTPFPAVVSVFYLRFTSQHQFLLTNLANVFMASMVGGGDEVCEDESKIPLKFLQQYGKCCSRSLVFRWHAMLRGERESGSGDACCGRASQVKSVVKENVSWIQGPAALESFSLGLTSSDWNINNNNNFFYRDMIMDSPR